MKTNVKDKNSDLISVLTESFGRKMNLARIKLMAYFIISLCKVQTVNFKKIAIAFDTLAQANSSLRRIQRFIANYNLNSDSIAQFIFHLLPEKENLRLTLDRTNWKYGKVNINIFMLGIVYQGLAFPLLFSTLDKRGNSNSKERISLINRFITLFGKDCIACIIADREFVGKDWVDYLNAKEIPYYIRIRKNFKVFLVQKQKYVKAFWLFNTYQINQFVIYPKLVSINGQLVYLSGAKLVKGDYLILISFNKVEKSEEIYKQRWQIETCFKAIKSSGFHMEDTHLQDRNRIEKLLLLVMIAFVWAYKIGIFLDQNIKAIKIKKHTRREISLFKYGLEYIAQVFLNAKRIDTINIYTFLSCT